MKTLLRWENDVLFQEPVMKTRTRQLMRGFREQDAVFGQEERLIAAQQIREHRAQSDEEATQLRNLYILVGKEIEELE